MYLTFTIFFSLFYHACHSASDITDKELKYLADHLEMKECRHLVASLFFEQYEFPNDDLILPAVNKIPLEASCLELLQEWNKESGPSKTHSALTHRLNQMQRDDLATWVAETVFQTVSHDLEETIKNGVPPEDSKTKENEWTESPIEILGPDDVEMFDDDDDDLESALVALLWSGGIAAILYAIIQIGKLISRKRDQQRFNKSHSPLLP